MSHFSQLSKGQKVLFLLPDVIVVASYYRHLTEIQITTTFW